MGPAHNFELLSDDGRPTGGSCQRHYWSPGCRAGIGYEIVHSLEVPAPQMVEQLPDVLQFFATRLPVVAKPVIDVPKIFFEDNPDANSGSRVAAGGTVGGSANHPPLPQADRLTLQFRVVVGVVFKGFSKNRIQQRSPPSSLLTLQHLVEVFKVHAQDRVQQRPRHPQFLALQLRRFKKLLALFHHPRVTGQSSARVPPALRTSPMKMRRNSG